MNYEIYEVTFQKVSNIVDTETPQKAFCKLFGLQEKNLEFNKQEDINVNYCIKSVDGKRNTTNFYFVKNAEKNLNSEEQVKQNLLKIEKWIEQNIVPKMKVDLIVVKDHSLSFGNTNNDNLYVSKVKDPYSNSYFFRQTFFNGTYGTLAVFNESTSYCKHILKEWKNIKKDLISCKFTHTRDLNRELVTTNR